MNAKTENHPFEYSHLIWGELIYGTKEEINALGIGVGRAFPGEVGGPKRKLSIHDPRGLPCEINRWHDSDSFSARISFPGREYNWATPKEHANGIAIRECPHWDEYVGTAESLVAAGLARPEYFPGQPGMRKHTTTIYADGIVADCPPGSGHDQKRGQAGARSISKKSNNIFVIQVRISHEESERREIASSARRFAWERQVNKLGRPAPLTKRISEFRQRIISERRSSMKLVWSRPLPCFEWQLPDHQHL